MKIAQWMLVLAASLGVLAPGSCALLFDQYCLVVCLGSNPSPDGSDERESPLDDNDKAGEKDAKVNCHRVRHESAFRTFVRPLHISPADASHLPRLLPIALNHLQHRNSPLRC